jgi:hypothetical protein
MSRMAHQTRVRIVVLLTPKTLPTWENDIPHPTLSHIDRHSSTRPSRNLNQLNTSSIRSMALGVGAAGRIWLGVYP